jgi:1-pyrroline-5-carboxylate dehydrogenase
MSLPPFSNEPLIDFTQEHERRALLQALDRVRGQLGRTYPMIIGGDEVVADGTMVSVNPARPSQVIGYVQDGRAEHARAAIEAADRAFERWKRVSPQERAEVIVGVAARMRERRHEFAAWNILEVGKTWDEADGEIAETIDFFEYYARQLLKREHDAETILESIPTERNRFRYLPLGVGAIITPWNFPTAQMVGLSSAAIVAGNTVVVKPAETSPVITYHVVQLFYQAGLPRDALNFVTGPGEVVGEAMVDHPRTRFVGFTGSKVVGTRINQRAAVIQPGQRWIKRTILEMGGKNPVVVDETADLDAAADGIVAGAFGYQGQKCSAGSRAIIVDAVHDELVAKIVERARALSVGDPADPDVDVGPVIDPEAVAKITGYIEVGRGEGELAVGGGTVESEGGYFIEPTVFTGVAPDARIAQEEVFGPFLTVVRARDFDDALAIANSTEYGLTGSLYSQDRERIDRAVDELHVGNLYLNRKSTGAEVGIHPFGGFNMSGTDSKAGGPDYLLLFMQSKSISEKVA